MKIEIWSDIICPWCGLGQHRLEQALATFPERARVEVVHRSFQLDPHAPTTPRPVRDMLREKYRADDAQLQAMFARIEGLAKDEGLTPYVVGDNVVGNTRLAHELLALAAARGFEQAAWQRMYRAYFGERQSIFDVESLVERGREIGLSEQEVRAALLDGRYRALVENDTREAQALGATGVPFVVFDRAYAVAGAQPTEVFRGALEQAWQAHAKKPMLVGSDEVCGPDGCALPARPRG